MDIVKLSLMAGSLLGLAAYPACPDGLGCAPVAEFAEAHGLSLCMESENVVSFCSDLYRLSFRGDSRQLLFDGLLVYLNGPATHNSRWLVTEADIRSILRPLLESKPLYRASPPITVVLDPGHGGTDSGAVGLRGIHEKKAVLDIARRVRRNLRGCGADVKLTRERDTSLTLSDRVSLAKRWGADLFVSIHLNAAANGGARGMETYVLPAAGFPSTSGMTNSEEPHAGNRYDADNTRLGCYIHKGLLAATGADDRGVRRARYEVLREAPCPAVLVECGFISNRSDADSLARDSYRESAARGIAQGVLTFISRAVEETEPSLTVDQSMLPDR